jgi:uncharacterized BrkB/YihY/UPF0761 family membrane protein
MSETPQEQSPEDTPAAAPEPTRPSGRRELGQAIADFVKQNAADAVERALNRPLRRAAKRVAVLGLSLGFGITAGVLLVLALFQALLGWLGSKAAAYGICGAICLIVAALCAWASTSGMAPDDAGKK